jgi:hypothetical protein
MGGMLIVIYAASNGHRLKPVMESKKSLTDFKPSSLQCPRGVAPTIKVSKLDGFLFFGSEKFWKRKSRRDGRPSMTLCLQW